jgi:hypothetical protein
MPHKDYSATPLSAKLGIKGPVSVLLVGAPTGFSEMLEPWPEEARLVDAGAEGIDVAVVFATQLDELLPRLPELADSMQPAGRLWIAWPKKASGVATDIGFDQAQCAGLDLGLVDNKSASITTEFQGLQFVRRLRDRPPRVP